MYSAFHDWVYRNEEKFKAGFLLTLLVLNSAGLYYALALLGTLPVFLNYLHDSPGQYFYYLLLVTSLGNLLYITLFFISKFYKMKR